MGDGTSNRTGLGGYWWTHVDRSGRSLVEPYTGKVDPMDAWTSPAVLAGSIAPGMGIEDGAYHVRGYIGPEPNYMSEREEDMDRYFDAFYAKLSRLVGAPVPVEVCADGTCGELVFPQAGLGFSFHDHNVPLGADASDKLGFAFRIKLGPRHELDDDSRPFPVYVELPTDLTDVPDPTLGDQFGTQYAGVGEPNVPLCTFVNSLDQSGKMVGRADRSCFRHLTTQGNVELELTSEWQTFCLAWSAFNAPPYPPTDFEARASGQFARGIKLQFEGYRPDEAEPVRQFDFYVDDVWLLDQAKWNEICPQAIVLSR